MNANQKSSLLALGRKLSRKIGGNLVTITPLGGRDDAHWLDATVTPPGHVWIPPRVETKHWAAVSLDGLLDPNGTFRLTYLAEPKSRTAGPESTQNQHKK